MVRVRLGDVVGMTHRMSKSRLGFRSEMRHYPQRAVKDGPHGFHFETGMYHLMRPYVDELDHSSETMRFLWMSYCGLHRAYLSVEGICQELSPTPAPGPFCHQCGRCEQLAYP
jgi:hypothetical protein